MSDIDLEQGIQHNYHHRTSSVAEGDLSSDEENICLSDAEDSVCFSDADEGSCHSRFYSTNGGSYDESRFGCEIDGGDGEIYDSSTAISSVREAKDIESEVHKVKKVRTGKVERDCRICHLGLERESHECGVGIELGCSCKGDLAIAHKNCAETWFKIKGNRICEICHSIATNVAGSNDLGLSELSNESVNGPITVAAIAAPMPNSETRGFWGANRLLNFLLACMVFALVISWLFRFNTRKQ